MNGASAQICPRCGGPVMQLPRVQLGAVGLALVLIAAMMPLANHWLLLPGVAVALTGGWLILWAIFGKGRWCRMCKIFPG